jgi:15-cis-phytoene synthase
MDAEEALLREGNQSHLLSGLFFDMHSRKDVVRLHAFIRTVTNYVDNNQLGQLQDLIKKWQMLSSAPMRELEHEPEDDDNLRAVKNIARLKIIYGYDEAWVDAFLVAQMTRTKAPQFATLKQSLAYVYGSAEVIGLMGAQLLRLPKDAHPAAQAEARAIQWLAFIRDIAKDAEQGHCYFPQEDLKAVGLKDLTSRSVSKKPAQFGEFVQRQLDRYHQWQFEASQDLAYVPRRPRVALNTAIHGYNYIAKQIAKNPMVVYEQQVQPSRARLVFAALAHSFD